MGMAEKAWSEQEMAARRRATRPETSAARPRDDLGAAFDRGPMEMNRRELVPMAGVMLVVAGVLAFLLLYLTGFGRLTAQGAYSHRVGADIRALRETNTALAGDVIERSKTERIEHEARVLGLQPVTPAQTHPMPAAAVDPVGDRRQAQLMVP